MYKHYLLKYFLNSNVTINRAMIDFQKHRSCNHGNTTHCTIWTIARDVTNLQTECKATKRWPKWLRWVWTWLPKLEYSVQASLAWVGLTLWACQSFDSFWGTFPGVPSGTGNFPEVVGVILKESPVFYQFPLWSLGFLCDPRIRVPSLYKYEALPLLNIITFTNSSSLDLRPNLRLSA